MPIPMPIPMPPIGMFCSGIGIPPSPMPIGMPPIPIDAPPCICICIICCIIIGSRPIGFPYMSCICMGIGIPEPSYGIMPIAPPGIDGAPPIMAMFGSMFMAEDVPIPIADILPIPMGTKGAANALSGCEVELGGAEGGAMEF